MIGQLLYRAKTILKTILPVFLLDGYHFGLALLAALLYGFPSRKLKIIGVTGTNGKSTVVEMLSRIFEEAGLKVSSLSSIRFRINDREEPNTKRMTMPGRFFVQQFLSKSARAGCQYAILEVTSEGIKQHRHQFIDFSVALLTNLSPEHIESHGGFENYRQAKGKLFQATAGIHILNLDDENAGYFLQFPAREKIGYGLTISNSQFLISNQFLNPNPQILKAENIRTFTDGSAFSINGLEFRLKLLGQFNVYNALAAIAAAHSQGIDLEICRRVLEKMTSLPGRMEEVIKEPFKVFVDYAFTPNALEKVYQTLTQNYKLPTNRLICVLGACGGGRDKWKRPVLGQIAAQYCDRIILTNEDPYDENPQEIIDQIARGVENIRVNQRLDQRQSAVSRIIDRREAINQALGLARAGDVVIITGKGCEPSICLARGRQIPWDDRQVVREEFHLLPKIHDRGKSVRYEILPHPADLKIAVQGESLAELFRNVLSGMFAAAHYEAEAKSETTEREIEIGSVDQAALLVDFLNQVLYLAESNQEVYSELILRELSEKRLRGKLLGRKLKQIGVQIKGATHHDLAISQKNGRWQAVILFDI